MGRLWLKYTRRKIFLSIFRPQICNITPLGEIPSSSVMNPMLATLGIGFSVA
jgi:hypothetical protein